MLQAKKIILHLSMDRQSFLKASIGLAGTLSMAAKAFSERSGIIPPYLKPGDIIGITAPAGWISMEDIQPAKTRIEFLGYGIKVGKTIGTRYNSMSATDVERRKDFQDMLDDDSTKAILCARGGYGIVRIIDQLNFTHF